MNLNALKELLPGVPLSDDTYYRLVIASYAPQIDDIAQSILHSWRYNPKGEFGVLYLSMSPDCAYKEKLKQVHNNAQALLPQVIGKFNVRSTRCLDLTQPFFQDALGLSSSQLIDPDDFSVTQSVAREARNLGFEIIIAPSATGNDCKNLVVFRDRLNPPSYCIVDKQSIRPYP